MTWKPKLIVASAILILAIILSAFGFNHFIEAIGYSAAGYIFGTAGTIPDKRNKR